MEPDPPHFPPFLFNPFPPFPFVPSPPARAHTSVFPPPFSSPPPIVCSHGAASPLWSSDRLDHLERIFPPSPLSSGPHPSGPCRPLSPFPSPHPCCPPSPPPHPRRLSSLPHPGPRISSGGGAGPIANGNRGWLVWSVTSRERECGLVVSGGGAGPIANGSRGWLVSSVTGRERECGREIVNVLDEWCDKLEAGKAQGEGEGEARTGEGASAGKAKGGSSIDALLANEVAALKKQVRACGEGVEETGVCVLQRLTGSIAIVASGYQVPLFCSPCASSPPCSLLSLLSPFLVHAPQPQFMMETLIAPPLSPIVFLPPLAPTVCPPLAPTVCPPLAPTVCPPLAPTVCPPLAPTVCPPLAPTVCPPLAPTVCPPLAPTVCPPLAPTVCPPLAPTVCPPLAPTVCPPLAPTVCPPLAPTVCPPLAPPVRPPLHIPQPRFVSVESGCKALLFVRIREDARKGGKGEKGGKQLEEGEEKEEEGEKEEVGKTEEGEKEEEKGEGDKEGKEGDKAGEKEQEKEQEEEVTGGGEKEPEKEGQGGEGEKGEAGGEQGRVSPCELAEAVLRHAKATQQSATRFTLRLLPVETTCYASQEEIASAIKPLIAAHFPLVGQSASDMSEAQPKGATFGIIFEKRANEGLERAGVIDTVAKLVPAPHKVDLRNPDKTIMLQVVKTICFISILTDFKALAKYNLRQLCLPQEDAKPGAAGEAKPAAAVEAKPDDAADASASDDGGDGTGNAGVPTALPAIVPAAPSAAFRTKPGASAFVAGPEAHPGAYAAPSAAALVVPGAAPAPTSSASPTAATPAAAAAFAAPGVASAAPAVACAALSARAVQLVHAALSSAGP
ncbi:unnamed protein product [Closterium sp. NIES-65]|nr:unnamed protein product [Closterium sp. NIES-65]